MYTHCRKNRNFRIGSVHALFQGSPTVNLVVTSDTQPNSLNYLLGLYCVCLEVHYQAKADTNSVYLL